MSGISLKWRLGSGSKSHITANENSLNVTIFAVFVVITIAPKLLAIGEGQDITGPILDAKGVFIAANRCQITRTFADWRGTLLRFGLRDGRDWRRGLLLFACTYKEHFAVLAASALLRVLAGFSHILSTVRAALENTCDEMSIE